MQVTNILVLLIMSLLSTNILANKQKIYASNNSNIISLAIAYERMQGKPEHQLESSMIRILQKAQIQQGKFQEILGAYTMSSSQDITGDNTEVFTLSPYQTLSKKALFELSAVIAKRLNQDSVAVLALDPQESPNL